VSDEPEASRRVDLVRAKATALTADRLVSAEPLLVAPQFIGARLASPKRRALAMALDLLAIALLTNVGGLWLVAGMVLMALQLATRRGGVPRTRGLWLGWAAAALVLWLAVGALQDRWPLFSDRPHARSEKPHAALAELDADAAADTAATAAATTPAEGDAGAAAAMTGASAAALSAQQRVARLEAELATARQKLEHKSRSPRDTLMSWLDEIGAGLGWGIVYFSLLPAWWRGQTLGKKLMRLRVVELAGQPITVMRSLKRYGGYVAGLATGGIGLLQVLWDPNRQGLHDKAAHTVVLDERTPCTPTP
jgi:RDD family